MSNNTELEYWDMAHDDYDPDDFAVDWGEITEMAEEYAPGYSWLRFGHYGIPESDYDSDNYAYTD